MALTAVAWGGFVPAAHAGFVGKDEARAYVLRVVPPGAPRVMLRDERAGFFRTGRLWVQQARGCHRRSADAVTCRFAARLVPDSAHRARNWWPISCRGTVLVGRMSDGRLLARQRDYVCRTVRP